MNTKWSKKYYNRKIEIRSNGHWIQHGQIDNKMQISNPNIFVGNYSGPYISIDKLNKLITGQLKINNDNNFQQAYNDVIKNFKREFNDKDALKFEKKLFENNESYRKNTIEIYAKRKSQNSNH